MRTFSDYAPVFITWKHVSGRGRGRSSWRLDTSLLMRDEVRSQGRKEIEDFFLVHMETQNKVIMWDTFKAYIWGVFMCESFI